jgi:hypothetical protein
VLDASHRTALRNVARGAAMAEDAAAVRNLSVAGLVQPVDGAWTVTQAGHAVLELEGAANASGGDGDGAAAGGGSDVMSKIRDWFMT